jgi:predicted TPR repeat methyltransferase
VSQVEAYTRLAGVYDEIVVDPCHGAWASFLDDVWRADVPGVRDVLDVCCGTGLLAAELTALGYRVVGVDASDAMLVRARELLGPDVPLVRTTLPELAVDGVFDAAVCTYDGLNYLDPADLRATFAVLAGRLRPAGWLVFDIHTDAMMRFIASQPVVDGDKNGHRYTIESTVDAGARTCDTRIQVEGTNRFSEHHRQYFHRASEIRAALVASGFEVTAIRDDYSDRTVDSSTLSATWIARRRGLPDRVAP